GEGTRKPRRRRGGRNRRREGAATPTESGQNPSQHVAANEGSRPPRGERRPPRERKVAEASGHQRPSRQVEVTSGKTGERHQAHDAGKPGLFRRLTRLFTGK
ncbi:MAG TPA: ATP-dependent RNA helicase RhlB, partial [Rhodanobacter sp.]|nr:ATP-dependent RNA helicase RhlB [Rhodanobacter sp.]